MDSGTVFYIIAVIIYFLYTAFQQRKAKNKEADGDSLPDSPPQEAPPKGSFDDILREIRRQQEERERDIVIAGEKSRPASKEDAELEPVYIEEEIDEPSYPSKKPESTYKDPYRSLSESRPLVKLDDQVDIHEDVKILGKVESSFESQTTNPYATLLKNPQTLVDAIVVSAILERKHF
ncbi:hypothetical protein [Lunatibacter salilacus]|uniref:hypothetical protein n=1 Tax=Lunatibacter salilacus TaxID=2483804 RepID=UPI00131AB5AD|nr:hypothetical protein [Lunatibacter salilacus]